MTADPDGTSRDDAPVSHEPDEQQDGVQDVHPVPEPGEPDRQDEETAYTEPPPLDVDEREGHEWWNDPPEVIELPEPGAEPLEAGEEPSFSVDPPPFEPGATSELPPPAPAESSAEPSQDVSGATTGTADEPVEQEPVEAAQPASTPAGKGFLAGAASRIGLGRLLETSEEPGPAAPEARRERVETDPASHAGVAGGLVRAREGFRGFLDPRLHVPDLVPHRRFAGTAAIIGLLFLLANSGGLALIVLSCVVPVLILMTVTQHDVFEKESNLLIAAVGAGGVVAGLVLSALGSWIQGEQWFDSGRLNFGAGGFSARYGEAADSAPWLVWLMVGLVIPAAAVACIAGIPIALRRWPQFRNEVMDGMILTSASAAGFAIGASVVYWWPMVGDPGPQDKISDWTLRIVGVAVVRTVIVTLSGALIGAGIWRYMMTSSNSTAIIPVAAGVMGILLLTLGSIQLQSSGAWSELFWAVLVLAALFLVYRRTLDDAIATDQLALGKSGDRVVCPSCRRVTPNGAFCAYCGTRLSEAPVTPVEDQAPAGTGEPAP